MTPGDYLTKAKRAAASAQLLLDNGDYEGARNRVTSHLTRFWEPG